MTIAKNITNRVKPGCSQGASSGFSCKGLAADTDTVTLSRDRKSSWRPCRGLAADTDTVTLPCARKSSWRPVSPTPA